MPATARMLYFDHNATSPLCAAARDAWLEAVDRFVGNPSSPHRMGARADTALVTAREKLAAILGCNPDHIIWTSGATESNNTAVQHFAAETDGQAWISAIEHPSLFETTRHRFGKRMHSIPVDRNGAVNVDWLRTRLRKDRPAFVAVMAANNETGLLQPWHDCHALCQEHGVPFICDVAQWIGKLPAEQLGKCEFLSGCAHKFGGPQGVGFLKCPARIHPLLRGGPQEERRRAGTENVAGILAMIAALEYRQRAIQKGEHCLRETGRDSFCRDLKGALPGVEFVGAGDRLWNTVSVVMPELASRQRWLVKLDKLGIAVSTGSACSSGEEKPSHVLTAMQLSDASASRVLRFSSGWETSESDWKELVEAIMRVWKNADEIAPRRAAVPGKLPRRV